MEIVGATLVVAQNPEEIPALGSFQIMERGQPQGIAPTDAEIDARIFISKKSSTIGDIISAFKSITTVKYIHGVKIFDWPSFDKRLWQRDYYEHIIRNEIALNNIANYIIQNPKKWNEDRFR